jgi:5-methylcytosine-specific restriction endonuclease McrA
MGANSVTGRRGQQMLRLTLAVWGTMCHLCGKDGADSRDHVIPRAKGGPDTLDNSRPAHMTCNRLRSDMDLPEWYRRHPLPARAPVPPSRAW